MLSRLRALARSDSFGRGSSAPTFRRYPWPTDPATRRSTAGSEQPEPVVHHGHRLRGHLTRPLRAPAEHLVQLGRIVHIGLDLIPDRRDPLDEHLAEVLLQVAVSLARVGVLQ